jgi:hypothetical protein
MMMSQFRYLGHRIFNEFIRLLCYSHESCSVLLSPTVCTLLSYCHQVHFEIILSVFLHHYMKFTHHAYNSHSQCYTHTFPPLMNNCLLPASYVSCSVVCVCVCVPWAPARILHFGLSSENFWKLIVRSLHDVHEMNAFWAGHVCLSVCLSIPMIQLENRWTDLHEI